MIFNKFLEWKIFLMSVAGLVNNFVFEGSVAMKFNDDVDKYFQTKNSLRQGDQLSPCYFTSWQICMPLLLRVLKLMGN
jgi:hypothetical protein